MRIAESVLALLLVLTAEVVQADVFNMLAGRKSLEMVPVGDPGNAADTALVWPDKTTGYGAVEYAYQIGKYEITNAQYCEFLNTKLPAISDPETGSILPHDRYALYNRGLETSNAGGISYDPSGPTGSKFSVKPNYDNRPVLYICWYDAVRFVNWLQNGQGGGDTESGTYTITAGGQNSGTVAVPDATTRVDWAASDPHWVLPSENEWYKAAFYDPGKQGGAGYWIYPTRHGYPPEPSNVLSSTGNNNANFYRPASGYTVGPPYCTSEVGAFTNSPSAYGTFDQGGNAFEWNESLIGPSRGLRGGSWYVSSSDMASTIRNSWDPAGEDNTLGFRVARVGVPEPPTIALFSVVALGLLAFARRRH